MKHLAAPLVSALIALAAPVSDGAPTPRKISPALQAAVSRAGGSGHVASWVFFNDKGSSPSLADVEANLTAHARARRARNRGLSHLVDAYDVPVNPRYVDAIRRPGLRIRSSSRWLNAVSIDTDGPTVAAIAELPFVRGMDVVRVGTEPLPEPVEEPAPLGPEQPRSTTALDYGLSFTQNNQINVPALHDQGYSGAGVWIAMLDAGVNNLAHVAFQNIDILITHDFVNGDSLVSDGGMGIGNHGTWTLSAIGGYAPGNLIGPAYGASYILAKTENTASELHSEEDWWVAAAEWADSIGTDIVSSSLGYTSFDVGVDYTWNDMDGNTAIVTIGADIAASRGILVVNSAGNGGNVAFPANTLGAPGDGDSVLAVGSVDAAGVRSSFSSVGPSADGRTKPDVMAMGSAVRLASASNPATYTNLNGTSFSCPLTAGAAALIMEAKPNASNQEIMDALRSTASQSGAPDRLYGWGIIDVLAAASSIAPTGVGDTPPPAGIVLHPAYPNPFNPTTTIEYEIPARVHVRLTVFDVGGAMVARLVDETQSRGRKSVTWNARSSRGTPLASGVYLYRLEAGGEEQTRKMVLLK
jgi:serine protease AprX